MTSKAEIEQILSQSPYNTSHQATLEAYVDAQAKNQAGYSFVANKALLKIYQCNPSSANTDKIATILLLTLLEYPSTDVLALSYLIPEKWHKTEPCATLFQCSEALDNCNFVEFWKLFSANSVSVVNAQQRLQQAIVTVLSLSYQTASTDSVMQALNMTSADGLDKFDKIASVEGNVVKFVISADNSRRNRVFQEGVQFPTLAAMMAKVSTE